MSVNLEAVHLALRARALTLSVATTGSATLSATATGYARASGSFVTDGFVPGMEATPTGFASNTTVGLVTAVTALALTIEGGRTVESAAGSRSLAMGLPALRAWDGIRFTPTSRRWYVEETFRPATQRLLTNPGAAGVVELTGLYLLRLYAVENFGSAAPMKAADALLRHFLPESTLALASGDAVRIRGDVGPMSEGLLADVKDWLVKPVTIPWRLYTTNA